MAPAPTRPPEPTAPEPTRPREHAARVHAAREHAALADGVARARLRYEALLGLLGRVERRAVTGRGRPAAELRRRVTGLTTQVEQAHRHLVDLEEVLERRNRPGQPVPPAGGARQPAVAAVQQGLFDL